MSTAPQPPAAAPAPAAPKAKHPDEVVVVSHSNLFYWWPVWAVAFLMAALTYLDGSYMVTVPPGSEAVVDAKVFGQHAGKNAEYSNREAIVLGEGRHLPRAIGADPKAEPAPIRLHMTKSKNYGVIFCITVLLVIVITNVPLRGMWSVVVIITIILLSVIFALAELWEKIFATLGLLDIRINAGGYVFLGLVLFAIWLVTLLFFDRQVYVIFSPRQFKVRTEIGGGEKVMDTIGLKLEKQKGDLFRHYILGLGSGDLIVKTTGAAQDHYDLPNVLFINKKVQQIEDLIATQRETR
ncbi:MAG: hypothetical protein U0797_14665 [Gemmataceae bacterium]